MSHPPLPAGVAPALLDPADHGRYLLHDRYEILAVLRALRREAARVTVHFAGGRDFLLSSLVAINDDGIVLDEGGSEEANRRALVAGRVLCSTRHGQVRVQFALAGLQRTLADGRPAFCATLPASLLRLQRRDHYRLALSAAEPLSCAVRLAGAAEAVTPRVIDLSAGGLGLVLPADIELAVGTEISECRLALPGSGSFAARLRICHAVESAGRGGAPMLRAGCQFVGLQAAVVTTLQRYILAVERQRKAREQGLA